MGAWGTGPFENDNAGDWFDKINKIVSNAIPDPNGRAIERVVKYQEFDEVRAAIEVMIRIQEQFFDSQLEDAIEVLEVIRGDEDWIRQWQKPATIRKSIDDQIHQLRDIVRKRLRSRGRR